MKMMSIKFGCLMLIASVLCCVPVAAYYPDPTTLTTKMIADKNVYNPGDDISYKIWADVSDGLIDHCYDGTFDLDPNIESISTNMPTTLYPCPVTGNKVHCWDPTATDTLWGSNGYIGATSGHGWLPVYPWFEPDRNTPFTISGKIKPGTPQGTKIKSTAFFQCFTDLGSYTSASSESDVTVASPCPVGSVCTPEFPSLFIPLVSIIGFLGTVLLIKGFRKA